MWGTPWLGRLNKGDDVVVCFPGTKIEAIMCFTTCNLSNSFCATAKLSKPPTHADLNRTMSHTDGISNSRYALPFICFIENNCRVVH